MGIISSFTLNLAVDGPITFQGFSGFSAFNLFYELVRSIDPGLVEGLRSFRGPAPWAATPFISGESSRVIYRKLNVPSTVSVTFTMMDEAVLDAFRKAILSSRLKLELAGVKFKLLSITFSVLRFSEIASSVDPLPTKFAVGFITPTAFRRSVHDCCPTCPHYEAYLRNQEKKLTDKPCEHVMPHGNTLVPLPLPSLMFRNLARIWSSFSDTMKDVWSAVKWAEEAIIVTGFPRGIRTRRLCEDAATNRWITGFTGKVNFAVKENAYDERHAKTVAALLRMAERTNTGVRRTAGLGMIKYFEPLASAEHIK
ncbi:MAG: CRISPR system precrRNA processing endoribonuclease RAMP protein Cas6 [Candidatus Jordarchaeales archaeon]